MALVRLTGADEASVEVPDAYSVLADLQSPAVPLVAAVTPWTWPEAFRPNINVSVAPISPERCTPTQHLAMSIAEQITLGVHVAAVDVWGDSGFRVTSMYPGLGTTIVQLQYVGVRGRKLVTLTQQQDASKYVDAQVIFAHAVQTLEIDPAGRDAAPDPATEPRPDSYASGRGEDLLDLSRVAGSQPWQPEGPVLNASQVAGLHEGRLPKESVDDVVLGAELCKPNGKLTAFGKRVHRALDSPDRTVDVEATDGSRARSGLRALMVPGEAFVLATPPPGKGPAGMTLDLMPPETVAIAVARWIGLAPAWTWPFSNADDGAAVLDADLLEKRIGDPDVPAPSGSAPGLTRFWAEPWTVSTVCGSLHPAGWLLVSTSSAGLALLEIPDHGTARIAPLPSAHAVALVLGICGFEVATS